MLIVFMSIMAEISRSNLNPAGAAVPPYSIGICADPDVVFHTHVDAVASIDDGGIWLAANAFAGTIKISAADQVGRHCDKRLERPEPVSGDS